MDEGKFRRMARKGEMMIDISLLKLDIERLEESLREFEETGDGKQLANDLKFRIRYMKDTVAFEETHQREKAIDVPASMAFRTASKKIAI